MEQVKSGWRKVFSEIYGAEAPCTRKKIIYKNNDFPGIKIISKRHAEKHADNTPGEWYWAEYYAIVPGYGIFKKNRLIDLKLFIQEERWRDADVQTEKIL